MDEAQLIAALRNGDSGALTQLVDATGDRLLRSAFLLCGHEADAQDLVQETFLQALRTLHRFRGQSNIYTWLHGILLNLARHYYRDRKRVLYCEEPPEPEGAETGQIGLDGDQEFTSTALLKALDRVSASHREVLILRFHEGMKIDGIARHLGISRGTVKSRLHYALQQMQKLLPSELNVFVGNGTDRLDQ